MYVFNRHYPLPNGSTEKSEQCCKLLATTTCRAVYFEAFKSSSKLTLTVKTMNFFFPKILTVKHPELTNVLQNGDPSEDEGPSNEAYDEAGILTAHLLQLLDLHLVAGPKPSTSDNKASHESLSSFPTPTLQPDGSQQPAQELVTKMQELQQEEQIQGTGLPGNAQEQDAAGVTPSAKIVASVMHQHASQNGLLPGKVLSFHEASYWLSSYFCICQPTRLANLITDSLLARRLPSSAANLIDSISHVCRRKKQHAEDQAYP